MPRPREHRARSARGDDRAVVGGGGGYGVLPLDDRDDRAVRREVLDDTVHRPTATTRTGRPSPLCRPGGRRSAGGAGTSTRRSSAPARRRRPVRHRDRELRAQPVRHRGRPGLRLQLLRRPPPRHVDAIRCRLGPASSASASAATAPVATPRWSSTASPAGSRGPDRHAGHLERRLLDRLRPRLRGERRLRRPLRLRRVAVDGSTSSSSRRRPDDAAAAEARDDHVAAVPLAGGRDGAVASRRCCTADCSSPSRSPRWRPPRPPPRGLRRGGSSGLDHDDDSTPSPSVPSRARPHRRRRPQRPAIAMKVDNYPSARSPAEARPQSGLQDADVDLRRAGRRLDHPLRRGLPVPPSTARGPDPLGTTDRHRHPLAARRPPRGPRRRHHPGHRQHRPVHARERRPRQLPEPPGLPARPRTPPTTPTRGHGDLGARYPHRNTRPPRSSPSRGAPWVAARHPGPPRLVEHVGHLLAVGQGDGHLDALLQRQRRRAAADPARPAPNGVQNQAQNVVIQVVHITYGPWLENYRGGSRPRRRSPTAPARRMSSGTAR